MSKELDALARIGLADAVRCSYEAKYSTAVTKVNMILVQLEIACLRAFDLYDRVTIKNLRRINKKIENVRSITTLDKPKSIITLIEFALAVLDEPCKRCKGERSAAFNNIASILLQLAEEISGGKPYMLSSMAAARYADAWDSIEI